MTKNPDIPALGAARLIPASDSPPADACDFIAGRTKSTSRKDITGCPVKLEAVLVRLYPTDAFHLAVRLGDRWQTVAKVRPDDPAIRDLPMLDSGPDPSRLRHAQRMAERSEEITAARQHAAAQRAAARQAAQEAETERRRAWRQSQGTS